PRSCRTGSVPACVFLSRDLGAARGATPPPFGARHNGSGTKGKAAARLCALLRRRRVLAPALLLGIEERGEDLADGALADVARDEHDAALAVVALGPCLERRRRME